MTGSDTTPRISIRRSQLGRARGLGAARAGSAHWWAQRVSALALVPLSLWFIAGMIGLEGAPRAAVAAWLHGPVALVLLLCLIAASFWHMALGLTVVIEDYVHQEGARLTLVLGVRAASVLLALLCAVSALRLGL
ncbi:MAG: succinate dehydrogenase, hydrophobic membrane anchor protein [Rhodospirillales bacterium]|nr:succinate dehydrogenase, hydrophobic membrane anchor protein [Rhodospirillales bacterium]